MQDERFGARLRLRDGYEFAVGFPPGFPFMLVMDEPVPLGRGRGPNAARILGAAIGNCLAASLLYCLRKAHIEVKDLEAAVEGELVRNEAGRLRVAAVQVRLAPVVAGADRARMARCLDIFEDFCVVTQSVRQGIEVSVDVDVAPAAETGAGRSGEIGATPADRGGPGEAGEPAVGAAAPAVAGELANGEDPG